MTFESMVPWLLASTFLAFFVRKAVSREAMPLSFLSYNGLAAAVSVAGAAAGSATAVWAGAVLWLALVMLPIRLMALIARRDAALDYVGAWRYAAVVRVLHPSARTRQAYRLYAAMAHMARGDYAAAAAGLSSLRDDTRVQGPLRVRARVEHARITGDWASVLVPREMLDPLVALTPERAYLLASRMRACAELGRLDDMVTAFTELREDAQHAGTAMQLLNGAMCAAAFTGRRAMVDKIIRLYGAALPADSGVYWLGLADLAAGGAAADAARADLQALARTTRQTGLAHAIELRLQRPMAAPSSMNAVNTAAIDAAQDVVGAMQAMPGAAPRRGFFRRAPMTALLILVNLFMFALEMWNGDSMDAETLFKLGAMVPDAVTQDGEWWRLVAALFLHAGPAHIVANMLALAVIGAVVERRYGAARFLLAYFITGLGSMAAIMAFVDLGWVAQDLFVGASGAIMGLLGMDVVLIVQAGRGAFARREDKAQIWVVVAVIALQTTFDLSHPQVSFAAHAGGLVLGLLTALAFNSLERRAWRRS